MGQIIQQITVILAKVCANCRIKIFIGCSNINFDVAWGSLYMIRTQLSTCSLLYVSWLFDLDMKFSFSTHSVCHTFWKLFAEAAKQVIASCRRSEDVIVGNTSSPCWVMEHLLLVLESSQHVVKILNRIFWTFNFNIYLRMRAPNNLKNHHNLNE